MTRSEIDTLLFIVLCERPVTAFELGAAFYPSDDEQKEYDLGRACARGLVKGGALWWTRAPLRYLPTERGRIAAALLLAKSPERRNYWLGSRRGSP